MKKYIYSLIAVTLVLMTGCDDFLDTNSPSKQNSENLFDTAPMAEAALMGVYGSMANTYVYGQKLSVNWQNITDIENCNLYFNNYMDVLTDYGPNHYYNNSANATTRWNQIFLFAELASAAVEGLRKGQLIEDDPDTALPLLGEALTLRALAYFELIRLYGDIPYKEGASESDLSNVYMGKVDRDIAYEGIIENLKEAIGYLPWLGTHSYNLPERITKGFAKGLLARVALFAGGWSLRDGNLFPEANTEKHPDKSEMGGYYVGRNKNWREYYELAIQQCAELLGDPENPHQLDPDFENIWKTVNGLGYNPYNENLFEIAFGETKTGDIGSLMGWEVQSGSQYGIQGMGSSYVTSTMYYFYSFHKEDQRRDVTLTFCRWRSDDHEDVTFNPVNVHYAKWRMYWMTDSYKQTHLTATGRTATGINWILMRYSDVYLMFAEAMNELYGPDQTNSKAGMTARAALETVRARAFGGGGGVAEYDKSDFFEAIVNERAWEFGCEAIRKQDLIRWGLLDTKIETMKETLCLMIDNQHPVTIFDKSYQPSDFPSKVYYGMQADGLHVDRSTLNYYQEVPNPPANYQTVNWFPTSHAKPESGSEVSYRETPAQILIMATGINPSYDYSHLLSRMQHGSEIDALLKQYPIGNNTCFYRHHFAIYDADIYQSQGHLVNSYGY